MEFFFKENNDINGDYGQISIKLTSSYLEVTENLSDFLIVYYIFYLSPTSILVSTSFDYFFDGFLDNLEYYQLDVISETYPSLTQSINNTINHKFHKFALVRFQDFDILDFKWFLITTIGNISLKNSEDLIKPEITNPIHNLISKSIEILGESKNNNISSPKGLVKSFFKGLFGSSDTRPVNLFLPINFISPVGIFNINKE